MIGRLYRRIRRYLAYRHYLDWSVKQHMDLGYSVSAPTYEHYRILAAVDAARDWPA